MLKELAARFKLTENQSYKLDYIIKLMDLGMLDEKEYEWYLFCPLNDTTEEIARERLTLMLLIKNDNLVGSNFEDQASLGVEVLIRDVNYSNLHSRVKNAILEEG